jgi:hypothetical protein
MQPNSLSRYKSSALPRSRAHQHRVVNIVEAEDIFIPRISSSRKPISFSLAFNDRGKTFLPALHSDHSFAAAGEEIVRIPLPVNCFNTVCSRHTPIAWTDKFVAKLCSLCISTSLLQSILISINFTVIFNSQALLAPRFIAGETPPAAPRQVPHGPVNPRCFAYIILSP